MNLQLLAQWTLTSALLILVVLAVGFFTRNRLSCVNRYALWTVVLVRLLAPFQLPFLPVLPPAGGVADLAADVGASFEGQMVYAVPEQVYPGRPGLEEPIIDRTVVGRPERNTTLAEWSLTATPLPTIILWFRWGSCCPSSGAQVQPE